MTTIEERIVQMKFQGDQFLAGIDKSLSKLDQFNAKMKSMGNDGLDKVGASADRLGNRELSSLAKGVDLIAGRFKAMGVVGVAALSNITNQAIFAGQNLVKSLTLGPVLDGFHEYETNMTSIQTILANTQAAFSKVDNATHLKAVTDELDNLNHYSDETIYNFSEMARNIGTFTAAGVALKPAAQSIKGIANLAALSGSNSEQASSAMYQLSQAISSGRVSLEDWNSVVNAGMGGTVFQRALANTAVAMGELKDSSLKLVGPMKNVSINGKSFHDSIMAKPGQQSWLSSKVLQATLAQFSGDLSNAQLKAQGFNDAQIKSIQQTAKLAKESATQVKTLSQLLSTVKESVGSGWANTWKIVFGDFTEAKGLFTGVNNSIGAIITRSAEARNHMLQDWKDNGGRTALIDAINFALKDLLLILKPIRQAWNQAFPSTSGLQLANITKSIREFFLKLTPTVETLDKLKRTFQGVFAVVGIGWDIFKQLVGVIFRLVGAATKGSSGFLDFTAKVGDFLVNLRQAIKDGKGVENFFKGLETALSVPIKLIRLIGEALSAAFANFNGKGALDAVRSASKTLAPLAKSSKEVASAWEQVVGVLKKVWGWLTKIGDWIITKMSGVTQYIANAFSDLNFSDITKGINTGLFAGLVLMFKQWLGGGDGGGLLENIKEGIEGLTKTLSAMQNALNAVAILAIAGAIAVLAVSMNILAGIDAQGLMRGSAAMAGLFAQLAATLIILDKMSSFTGVVKLPFLAASLVLLAIAIGILALSMKVLATLSWEDIAKGLTAVTGILAQLVVVAALMPKGKSFIMSAASMVIMAFAVKKIAEAVAALSGLSWDEMARGLVGVGVLMAALLVFANASKLNIKGLVSGVVVILMAKAIQILANALKDITALSWGEMAKGLATTAIGLGILAGALKLIPASGILNATGLVIAAVALQMVNDVLQKSAGMSWEEIGKGLAVMAASLGLLAGALNLMTGALPGAGALAVAAVSLQLLSTSLAANAKLSWEEIAKGMAVIAGSLILLTVAMYAMGDPRAIVGAQALIVASGALAIIGGTMKLLSGIGWTGVAVGLTALAGVFVVLGVAGLVLQPVIPAIYALAISIGLIGAAMLLAGAGVALFGVGISLLAAGFAALAVSGVAGATAVVAMIGVLAGAIPAIIKIINDLFIAILQMIIKAAPVIGQAFIVVLDVILKVIVSETPKIIDAMGRLLSALLDASLKYIPRMVDTGMKLVTGLLNGIAKNIGKMAPAATRVVVEFINAVGNNSGKVADAGAKMIVKFVNAIAAAIRNNSAAMGAAGANLASAIIEGMARGMAAGVGRIADMARNVAHSALDAAKAVLGIHSPSKEFEKIGNYVNDGFRKGLDGNRSQIDDAFKKLASDMSALYKSAGDDIVSLTKKLAKLKSARHKDKTAIADTTAALKEAKKEKNEASAALKYMNTLKDEHSALDKLADKYDVLTDKIKAAQDVYNDAIKTRDDYNKSVSDQYGNALDPTGEMTATDYVDSLNKQLENTKEFANKIQQLRKLGINDETYKDLLSAGTSALPFITDLLNGGQSQIDQINDLNKQLDSVSASMGKTASSTLYQAAVDSAAGIVKGLQDQQAAIERQMDKIADAMVKAIKKKLGIKSPSRVMAEVGMFSMKGLGQGFEDNTSVVTSAAANAGEQAVEAMRLSLSNVDKMVAGNLDLQPTIRPVLDLTDIQNNAGKIGSMIPTGAKMTLDGSYSAATSVAAAVNDTASGGTSSDSSDGSFLSYTQNIYSPKAVSPVEVYRGTKNQLSTVKGALANS